MHSETMSFTDGTGLDIFTHVWLPDTVPLRAVVQIAHGMSETASRYTRFAQALTDAGFAVYANDHRGHGRSVRSVDDLGYLGDDGYNWMIRNMHQLNDLVVERHPHTPVFLFGHSMGSYLGRHYAALYGKGLRGLVLSGSNVNPGILLRLGRWMANREMASRGPRARSERLNKMVFGSYNKPFRPARTAFDWLSRDEREVDLYVNDPHCGTVCTTNFFYWLFTGLLATHQRELMQHTPKELPIHLIAGDRDSAANQGKGVLALARVYKDLDCRHVTYRLYPEARHELLNEINRDDVTQDLIHWFELHL